MTPPQKKNTIRRYHRWLRTAGAVVLALAASYCHGQTKAGIPTVKPVDHLEIRKMVTANKGRVTVVNVWASWCDPCREEMPSLVKLRQKYREKGLDLILVSADDIEKRDSLVPSVLRQLGVDFDSFIDRDSTDEQFITGMNADWSGALPTTFVYDTSGNLFKMMVGGKSYDAFEKVILSMLKPGE